MIDQNKVHEKEMEQNSGFVFNSLFSNTALICFAVVIAIVIVAVAIVVTLSSQELM